MTTFDDLKEGQTYMVHPTKKSETKHPFKVTVTKKMINWVNGPKLEWCIDGAVINEYLLSRMKLIG